MKIRAIVVLLAIGLQTAGAPAATPSAPLADRLPAGVLVYAGWAGRSLTFDGSMFGQLLNDPDIAKIVRAVGQAARKDIGDDDGEAAFDRTWAMADVAWQHPIALALIDLRKGKQGPEPTAVLLIDLDTDREAFAKHLDGLLNLAKDDIPLTEATLAGVSYRVHRPDKGPEISFGYLKNTFFLGLGAGAAETLIERPAAGKLSADKKFAQCLSAVADGEAQTAYYVDVSAMVDKIAQFVAPPAGAGTENKPKSPADETRKLAAAMGLDKISVVAGATQVVDRGLYSRTRIFTPAPHRGLLTALAGPEVTDADLADVPEDADFVLAARASAQAAWDELRRAVKDANPDADREFAKGVDKVQEHLGVSLSRDVFSQLGDTWVLSGAPSRGGFLAGTTLTVNVKDPTKLAEALRKIEAAILPKPPKPAGDDKPSPPPAPNRPRIETLKFARTDIKYLVMPSRRKPMPLAPAWTIHKNRFMLAGFPQVLQSAVAVNGTAKPITQTPDFRSARGRIAGKPSVLLYCNTPKIARQVYHWALIGWTTAANALASEGIVNAQPAWLPPLTTVEQYLRPSIAAVCPDAGGITFETYSSLPGAAPAVGTLLNPMSLAILVPAISSARRQASENKDLSDLRMLVMGATIYEMNHGKLPASLLDPEMRECIGGDRLKTALASGQYIYLGSRIKSIKVPNTSTTVLIYRSATDARFVLAGFVDGHVERLDRKKLQQLLAAQGVKP